MGAPAFLESTFTSIDQNNATLHTAGPLIWGSPKLDLRGAGKNQCIFKPAEVGIAVLEWLEERLFAHQLPLSSRR
jgi:hypothetical protein